MKKSHIITLAVGALLGIVGYKLLWTVAEPKISQKISQIGLTENEKAANGPLPGDVSLYAKELAAQNQIPTPGYYSSLNGAELADARRSAVFPAATFLGSHDGPNKVYAWKSEDEYEAWRALDPIAALQRRLTQAGAFDPVGHARRRDVELRLLVLLGQPVQQVEAGRHALRHRHVREGRQRVVVQLGRGAGELRERRHQRALGFVQVVQHPGPLES